MATQIANPLEASQWWPKTEAQRQALDSPAQLVFFGGSAGSLKSHTLCLDAIQERDNPNLRSIFFRESYPQLTDLVDKQQRLYRPLGAIYNEQKKLWKLPAGGTIRNHYLSADRDVYEIWGHEFSDINFDESTRFTEFQIRTVISRLRSTDPSLRLRVRLGSNPGGLGAGFHKSIFLHGNCPVHESDKAAIPGKVYSGRTWPSDGTEIPLTTCFIPGKLSDHTLLGSDYAKMLRMQSGALASQLESGCWCELSGAYFAGAWDKKKNVRPIAEIAPLWWWTHWISVDYGFGKSSAAAYLHCITETGHPRTIAEIVVPHSPVTEFAKQVALAFIKPPESQPNRRIVAIYADPSHRQQRGLGYSISDQMDEVFREYGLSCTDSANDRPGRWQLLYKLLKAGQWQIADNCPKLIESIPSRIHDEKKPGDLLKVPGDPLDDAIDSAGYGLYSFFNASDKPREMKLQKIYEDSPDPTSAMINLQRAQAELDRQDEPVYFSSRARQNSLSKRKYL